MPGGCVIVCYQGSGDDLELEWIADKNRVGSFLIKKISIFWCRRGHQGAPFQLINCISSASSIQTFKPGLQIRNKIFRVFQTGIDAQHAVTAGPFIMGHRAHAG